MPHSTSQDAAPAAGAGAGDTAMLDMYGEYNIPDNFDTTGNADDAVDYADLDDDDSLPEEEEATNNFLEEGEEGGDGVKASTNVAGGLGGLPASAAAIDNIAAVEGKPSATDLFGEPHEDNDLFGERLTSPEEERRPQPTPSQSQQRPGGLALPTKSSLALPRLNAGLSSQQPTSSLSPPPFLKQELSILSPPETASDEDDDDDDDLDEEARRQRDIQRELFRISKKRNAGENVSAGDVETDFDVFHQLFSGYEEYQIPRFVELFPPREIQFRGKEPLKPPKPVIPTKLTLELLPDQERSFRAFAAANKAAQDSSYNKSFVQIRQASSDGDGSDDDLAWHDFDQDERIGGVTMQDLALICEDWDIPSIDSASVTADVDGDIAMDGDWDAEERARPAKKRRGDQLSATVPLPPVDPYLSFDDPERMVAKVAKSVTLDLNDPNLLIDEHAPRVQRVLKHIPENTKRDSARSRDLFKRYNISNDEAYDKLKENHQNKVRSTLGSTTVEHSFPATILQYPFYKVSLDTKAKRSFHRPPLELKNQPGREYRFQKPKHIKKKNWRGKEAKEIFAKADDLSLGDNASALLLEYSEEAPMMISNFGMGNRLINYYRKKDADDQERPKREIGETQVLLTQDKSPFSTFGYVDNGEIVPTIQNGLYRAPVFPHQAKPADFIIGISSTYEFGDRFFLRNVENLHVVGQQFPSEEIPGQHSRKVTDAAKKRLRALAYRIYTKSLDRKDKVLDNATLLPHLPGHDMPQTRSKMREFMKYTKVSRGPGEGLGVWVPMPGAQVPDAETLRGWIRPEAVCVLDSMQVGVQHLADLGINDSKDAADEDKDMDDEGANIELQLAPWRATKNFLNACQSKAMLKLHGEGDPTGRGEGFSFVKTSMKGGFTAVGESAEDKIDARRRKENGGHSYNVAKQQKAYEDAIRHIWDKQKAGLSREDEVSDDDMDVDQPEAESASVYGRAATPRSSHAGGRHEDDSASQFSGLSNGRSERTLVITRKGGYDKWGNALEDSVEVVTNPRVIALYQKRRREQRLKQISVLDMKPTGDTELDAMKRAKLEAELARVQRNADRREAREKAKGRHSHLPSAADSPGPSDADAAGSPAAAAPTPLKGKGRNKDGTARKCANCGQVGHIKTNRKLCPLLNGTMKPEDAGLSGDSSFGAVPAPLTL